MNVPLIHHKSHTESTNRDLEQLIKDNSLTNSILPLFTTILAGYQTAGRGQGSNRWHSAPGENLLASIYFRPPIPAARQFAFNQYFALAVRKALLPYCPNVLIKWPNDIYVNGKKIAGILIEHAVSGDKLSYTIAGIGLNVNEIDFPKELPNPTSIALETGCSLDITDLMGQLLNACAALYPQLENPNFAELEQEYLSHLFRRGEWAQFLIAGQHEEARIEGLDKYGRLLLEGRNGQHWCCGMKEVSFVL